MKKPLSIYVLSFMFIGLLCGAFAFRSEMKSDHVAVQDTVEQQLPSVIIDIPQSDEMLSKSFVTKGKARGTWFFEGSFPIEVIDNNGTLLGNGVAHAQGDWMTKSYVAFDATITFVPATSTTHGFVLYKKDNPSGLPEHDAVIAVPVTFAK
jgi:hypothetical protein